MSGRLPAMKSHFIKMNHPVSKEDFCLFCRTLYDRHLVTGVGGNLSIRVGEKIFITPSGCSLGDMVPDIVITMNEEGRVLESGTPTKDVEVHLGVFSERPDVNVVCHTHGAYIIAVTTLLDPGPDALPPITPGFVYFAYPLVMIPFMVPGSREFAKAATHQFSDSRCSALLLQNHGLITVGEHFQEALDIAEEIDEVARVYLLTGGRARILIDKDVRDIKALKTSSRG
jgi:ribulose-5-phosphate 4-epimerase/fuculose-1-phosphate aldolase